MGIVGGAIIPLVQAAFADRIGIQHSYVVPLVCYVYIIWYGLRGSRLTGRLPVPEGPVSPRPGALH